MKKLIYIFLIIFILSLNLYGNNNKIKILTLKNAIKISLKNNIDIKNAILSFKENKLDQLSTLSKYIPIVGINYSKNYLNEPSVGQIYSSYPIEGNNFNPFIMLNLPGGGNFKVEYQSSYSHSYPTTPTGFKSSLDSYTKKIIFSFSQPILKNFLLIPYDINILKMAKYSKNIAHLTILEAANNIVYNTFFTYINIIINKLNLQIKNNSLERARLLLQKNLKNQKLGIVEPTDILASKAAINLRNSELLLSKNQIIQLKNNLKLLLNINYDFFIPTNLTNLMINEISSNFSENKCIEKGIKNSIQLKILNEQLKIEDLKLKNLKSQLLPDLRLFGNYTLYGNSNNENEAIDSLSDSETYSWNIGVNLSYHLYPLNQINQLKKEKLELKKIKNKIEKIKLEIINKIRKSIIDIKKDKERLQLLEESIKFQKEKLKKEERKYQIGKSSNRIILSYQDDLEEAETIKIQTLLHYYLSLLTLQYYEGTILKNYSPEYYNKLINLK